MTELQEIYVRLKQSRHDKKKANEVFRDVLTQSKPHQEVLEQLKALKAKKAQLEHDIRADFSKEEEEIERLTLDIKTDAQLLSDVALTKLMKGETIEITDENEVKYEPVFKVAFKKAL